MKKNFFALMLTCALTPIQGSHGTDARYAKERNGLWNGSEQIFQPPSASIDSFEELPPFDKESFKEFPNVNERDLLNFGAARCLDLSSQAQGCYAKAMASMPYLSVVFLNLSGQKNLDLQDLASKLPKTLQFLWLRGMNLEEIPDLSSLKSLKILSVAGNQIEEIKAEHLPPHLTNLDVSYNKIKKLPDLSGTSLETFCIVSNPIQSLLQQDLPKNIQYLALGNNPDLEEIIFPDSDCTFDLVVGCSGISSSPFQSQLSGYKTGYNKDSLPSLKTLICPAWNLRETLIIRHSNEVEDRRKKNEERQKRVQASKKAEEERIAEEKRIAAEIAKAIKDLDTVRAEELKQIFRANANRGNVHNGSINAQNHSMATGNRGGDNPQYQYFTSPKESERIKTAEENLRKVISEQKNFYTQNLKPQNSSSKNNPQLLKRHKTVPLGAHADLSYFPNLHKVEIEGIEMFLFPFFWKIKAKEDMFTKDAIILSDLSQLVGCYLSHKWSIGLDKMLLGMNAGQLTGKEKKDIEDAGFGKDIFEEKMLPMIRGMQEYISNFFCAVHREFYKNEDLIKVALLKKSKSVISKFLNIPSHNPVDRQELGELLKEFEEICKEYADHLYEEMILKLEEKKTAKKNEQMTELEKKNWEKECEYMKKEAEESKKLILGALTEKGTIYANCKRYADTLPTEARFIDLLKAFRVQIMVLKSYEKNYCHIHFLSFSTRVGDCGKVGYYESENLIKPLAQTALQDLNASLWLEKHIAEDNRIGIGENGLRAENDLNLPSEISADFFELFLNGLGELKKYLAQGGDGGRGGMMQRSAANNRLRLISNFLQIPYSGEEVHGFNVLDTRSPEALGDFWKGWKVSGFIKDLQKRFLKFQDWNVPENETPEQKGARERRAKVVNQMITLLDSLAVDSTTLYKLDEEDYMTVRLTEEGGRSLLQFLAGFHEYNLKNLKNLILEREPLREWSSQVFSIPDPKDFAGILREKDGCDLLEKIKKLEEKDELHFTLDSYSDFEFILWKKGADQLEGTVIAVENDKSSYQYKALEKYDLYPKFEEIIEDFKKNPKKLKHQHYKNIGEFILKNFSEEIYSKFQAMGDNKVSDAHIIVDPYVIECELTKKGDIDYGIIRSIESRRSDLENLSSSYRPKDEEIGKEKYFCFDKERLLKGGYDNISMLEKYGHNIDEKTREFEKFLNDCSHTQGKESKLIIKIDGFKDSSLWFFNGPLGPYGAFFIDKL